MKKQFKTIFISDIHLFSSHCKSEILLDFLKTFKSPVIYLVGDILDFWKLRENFIVPKTQIAVIKKFLKLAKNGVIIKYVLGNHDALIRGYLKYNLAIENIEIANTFIHESINGTKFLVIHGDQFDGIVSPLLYRIGDFLYELLLNANTQLNWFRNKFGFGYWSLSKYLKSKTKEALAYLSSFENVVTDYARKRKCGGIIAGHIHSLQIKKINEIIYMNDSDFQETCGAILEDFDGNFVSILYKNNEWIPVTVLSKDNEIFSADEIGYNLLD